MSAAEDRAGYADIVAQMHAALDEGHLDRVRALVTILPRTRPDLADGYFGDGASYDAAVDGSEVAR